MATTNANKTVVGVFDSMQEAQNVVRELETAGFSRDEISVVANKQVTGDYTSTTGQTADATSNVVADAGIGAALGGVGGLLLAFAGLAVPGIGPVLAAGPIIAALSGAGIGAVAGGLIGALTESGVPEEDAGYYAEGVRRGQVLVSVHADDSRFNKAQQIMDNHGAVDVNQRATDWKSRGWSGYDSGAAPLSADELRREREYSTTSRSQGDDWSNRTAQDIGNTTSNAAYNTGKAAGYTGEAARETGRDMKAGAERLGDKAADTGREMGRGVRDAANKTKDVVEDAGRSISRGASRVYDRVTDR